MHLGYIALTTMVVIYIFVALALFMYGVNCYVMIFFFRRGRRREEKKNQDFLAAFWRTHSDADLPVVTTQLPVYNEKFVVERLVDCVVAFDWPKEKHEIQLLDDSTDDSADVGAAVVEKYRKLGYDIKHIRRSNREGFKAGALAEGLRLARGQFIPIFDADFMPEPDFLRMTVPYFLADGKLGLVQTRWGHVNRKDSLLTRAQSIGIDGHFIIEQSARAWNRLYMNFNGTGGVWRKEAIYSAGGWEADTLTEDMDLSYRAQLAGWQMKYTFDVICPAEIPPDINAFKSQQHRWAKGSIQTAIKILPRVFRRKDSLIRKLEAFLHLTHYSIHPLMVLAATLAVPMLLFASYRNMPVWVFGGIIAAILLSMCAPTTLYVFSQKQAHRDWWKRILCIPGLMIIGVGIAINNSKAVLEALLGIKSGFVRTPKLGSHKNRAAAATAKTKYFIKLKLFFLIEIVLGLYCAWGFAMFLNRGKYIIGPFLLLYAAGFLFVGLSSLVMEIQRQVANVRTVRAARLSDDVVVKPRPRHEDRDSRVLITH
ncbi:MAG: cellulose synthase family protein [Planctomycetota bacterium]|jgi:cellulose synthase/poly-beta-1,6-N-acetylglucosamine synthase-like glycosyltransferase